MKMYRRIGGLKYWDWEGIIGFTLLGLLILFLFYIFYMAGLSLRNEAICLQNGYPQSNTTWKMIGYCIRTINQTQYVVPLNQLLGK